MSEGRPRPQCAVAATEATGFRYSGTELNAMAGARNYYAAILERFAPHLGARVVEVGAGIGTFASLLLDRVRRDAHDFESLTLIEPAANNYPLLERRFAGEPKVHPRRGYLGDHAARLGADTLIMVNVAEHVADDVSLLRDAYDALVAGGALLMFVPALPWLFGALDEEFEHYRRYTTGSVRSLLTRAGFAAIDVRYANCVGVVPWFLYGRILRRRTLDAASVRLYDTLVTPWVSRLEHKWRPPLGQSVLAIARRPAAAPVLPTG